MALDDSGPPQAPSARAARSDGRTTRTRILEAARRRLIEQGYAQLNVRDIASDAGVNHALISYHFGGKQPLVMAVLDEANRRLLERQARMYDAATAASAKWRSACEFYDQDLASGFVRLQMELMAASFHDEALRREFVPRLLAWQRLVEAAVAEFTESAGLRLPVSPRAIAAGICWYWVGMEVGMTLGITEEQAHHREALGAVAELLRRFERRGSAPARPRRSRR